MSRLRLAALVLLPLCACVPYATVRGVAPVAVSGQGLDIKARSLEVSRDLLSSGFGPQTRVRVAASLHNRTAAPMAIPVPQLRYVLRDSDGRVLFGGLVMKIEDANGVELSEFVENPTAVLNIAPGATAELTITFGRFPTLNPAHTLASSLAFTPPGRAWVEAPITNPTTTQPLTAPASRGFILFSGLRGGSGGANAMELLGLGNLFALPGNFHLGWHFALNVGEGKDASNLDHGFGQALGVTALWMPAHLGLFANADAGFMSFGSRQQEVAGASRSSSHGFARTSFGITIGALPSSATHNPLGIEVPRAKAGRWCTYIGYDRWFADRALRGSGVMIRWSADVTP